MIWLVLGIMLVGGLVFLCAPLYRKQAPLVFETSEFGEYKSQIAALEARIATADDPEALTRIKIELQRQLIRQTGKNRYASGPSKALLVSLIAGIGLATIGLYSQLGAPELTKADDRVAADMSLDQLVVRLEQKLQENPTDPNGWLLYARSLMTLQRYDDAKNAYGRTLVLTEYNADIAQEFENAQIYIEQRQGAEPNGPSADDIEAAAQMSPEERQAMVQSMVDGLSAKLVDNPDNPEGWVRLLRARSVLGQETEIMVEIDRMKAAFEGQPETIKAILAQSGVTPAE